MPLPRAHDKNTRELCRYRQLDVQRKGVKNMHVPVDRLTELAEDLAARAAHLIWTDRLPAAARRRVEGLRGTATTISPAGLGAERLIRELLAEYRPSDAVLGHTAVTPGQVTWVVDALNGNANYLSGLPSYSVSVAAMLDDVVLAAAVVEPHSRRTWSAGLGQGARLHDRMISDSWLELGVSSTERLDVAVVSTGFSTTAATRVIGALLPHIGDIRCSGSPALDLVHVAAGWTDAHVDRGVSLRERAAGLLIAEEAGATVCQPGLDGVVLASASRIFDALLQVLDRGAAAEAEAGTSLTLTAVRPRRTA
ncbi:inositol monophosphatase [Lentzea sp. NPDC042327]|uniref:inositol monophosphatase family protein n=1 Tax=Lentzea sp. NPDC042327 TaxID=3154801 RepID=UPI0033F4E5FB